jgi:hypothetical protein
VVIHFRRATRWFGHQFDLNERRPRVVSLQVRLRILFLALILLLPAQIGIRKLIDGEPYPGLFLPNFGPVLEKSSVVNFELAEIFAVLTNGVRVPLDPDNIMPNPARYAVTVARILSDPAKSNAEDVRSWLRERLAITYPDLDIASVSVLWSKWSYDETTGQRAVIATRDPIDITLGGSR